MPTNLMTRAALAEAMAAHSNEAQGFTIPLGTSFAAITATLTTQIQASAMLGDVVVVTDQPGSWDPAVAGNPLNISNQLMDIAAFSPTAQARGHRSIGFIIQKSLNVTGTFVSAVASRTSAYVACDPIPEGARPIPVNMLGPQLAYCLGLGNVAVPAGGAANLTATAQDNAMLGLFGLSQDLIPAALGEVTVTGILVNNRPMQNSPLNTAGAIELYDWQNTNVPGRLMLYPVKQNDTITIQLANSGAAPTTVRGGFFCIHPKGLY